MISGIIVDLIAAAIVAIVAFLWGRYISQSKLRRYLRLIQMLESHVLRTYQDWDECEKEIADELACSEYAAIIGIKGRRLIKSAKFRDALLDRAYPQKPTRILMQVPASECVNEEVRKIFNWPSLKSYRDNIKSSIQDIVGVLENHLSDDFSVALYDNIPLFKLYLFDDKMYVSIYGGKREEQFPGTWPQVWCLPRQHDTLGPGLAIERCFEAFWRHAVSPADVLNLD